eukprot:CAMPEP_0172316546 /NCGR_PEP_ID=MMETSP1058-20130122/28648_1 /TAXON_ID=83371 /ORGANISM="Detonula confervacea, Strain CCMP 353" /LENGTH=165 /DNA_ID=CAMNT_0013030881 /DNA_START=100 /DNA_END=593 /DNA_ORIENTATION=-
MASNNNQPNNNSSPSSPTTATKGNKHSSGGGGAFYGMLRKTKRRTYGALVRGGRKHQNANLEGGEEGDDDSSSDSAEADQALNSVRSPFTPSRLSGAGGGGVDPARSFYFSPLNSWHDHNNGQHTHTHTTAAGTRNDDYANSASQQQHHQTDNIGMENIVRTVER